MMIAKFKSVFAASLAFLACSAAIHAAPLTFQVDVGVQTAGGNFDPAADTVEVHGSFNGWSEGVTLTQSTSNENLYTGTVEVEADAGTAIQYKYVLNRAGTLVWEKDGVGPDGVQNRSVTLTGEAQTIPVVNYNNETAPPANVPVTFVVNMDIQDQAGNFDPALHTVEVRGGFNGWTGGFTLAKSSTNENVYAGTTDVFGAPGATFEYKFVIDQAGTAVWEGNVGPGGFGNRRLVLEQGQQVLPTVYFDNVTTPPAGDIPVTFSVDMSVQAALGAFNPDTDIVNVTGQFNNWNTTALELQRVGTSLVYTNTTTVRAAAGANIPYKFLINGGTWEAGSDRILTVQLPSTTLEKAYFSNVTGLGNITIVKEAEEIRLSWTPSASVELQSAPAVTGPWTTVADTQGVDAITLPIGAGNRFFRLATVQP